jgi:SAM-dependent methyltransferase
MTRELRYEPLEPLSVSRPVDRVERVVELCRARRVLDLGCLDETALEKRGGSEWLHGRIAAVAAEVLGVDASAKVPASGLQTNERARIVRGDVLALDALEADLSCFDVVVAGELIEHVPDAQAFLAQIKRLFSGKTLVLTTPNATSIANVVLALANRESNHEDHVAIFSFKTLHTLCRRAGFEQFALEPYHTYFTQMALRNRGARRAVVRALESIACGVETVVPLLSFGWIVHVERI